MSAVPGRHYPSPVVITHLRPFPAVSLIFVDACLAVFPNTCSLCPPPPAVLDYILPSSDIPYSPPDNPGRPLISPAVYLNSRCHMCLTVLRKAYWLGTLHQIQITEYIPNPNRCIGITPIPIHGALGAFWPTWIDILLSKVYSSKSRPRQSLSIYVDSYPRSLGPYPARFRPPVLPSYSSYDTCTIHQHSRMTNK